MLQGRPYKENLELRIIGIRKMGLHITVYSFINFFVCYEVTLNYAYKNPSTLATKKTKKNNHRM